MSENIGLSNRAIAAKKHANCDASETNMRHGPYLANDGFTLVIPSDWYKKVAADQWRSAGFTYHGEYSEQWYKCWTRDIRIPVQGYTKPHRPEVWLKSIRKQFFKFWPQLNPDPMYPTYQVT